MVPLFLQCDDAWWLPLTGLLWLPYILGSCAQGCHGYPMCSALVLEAPLSFQAPSPSSSIVDEFKFWLT